MDNKFGGDTVSIYQRTIKEIYGRQKGAEIIDLMTSHPRQTLPVVIDRLKSKYTEWKKAQVWNSVKVYTLHNTCTDSILFFICFSLKSEK